MSQTGDGFLRLDKETDAMALWTHKEGEWVCTSMADREPRLRSDMDKLRTKNRSLREQVDDLEEILGIGPEQPNSACHPLTSPYRVRRM